MLSDIWRRGSRQSIMLEGMAGHLEHTAALYTAIDGFMGRAQDLGLVRSVGDLAASKLLISGSVASDGQHNGPLPVPHLVVTASQRQTKEKPFSVAILGDKNPAAPVLVAADVSRDAAVSRFGPQDEGSPLPYPQIKILAASAEAAKPEDIDSYAAELLFRQMTDMQQKTA